MTQSIPGVSQQQTMGTATQQTVVSQQATQPTTVTTTPAAVPHTPNTNAATSPAPKITPTPAPVVVNSRNMDLLSGLDFAAPLATLPEVMLQPKPASSTVSGGAASVVTEKEPVEPEQTMKVPKIDDDVVSVLLDDSIPVAPAKMDHIKSFLMSAQQHQSHSPSPVMAMDRKMSMDNISICSEISSVDQNFDWESVSVKNDAIPGGGEHDAILSKFGAGEDPKAIKYFHGEVERLEKFLEGVNIKTLNGTTPLAKKWQEVQDLLAKDAGKRTTTVAKLFPEKNRSPDCIPYDHARVQLPTSTDDYVNASFVKVSELWSCIIRFCLS